MISLFSVLVINYICPAFSDPCKFFGCELGAQTQMDPKIGRYIVNGAHEADKLQDLLDVFIKNFVMCEQCDNPETALVSSLIFLLNILVPGNTEMFQAL